ncbi:MAG: transcriptional regulator [Polaromonas sp.]|nr:transcriptional regulator [Polaromonas sp.]
MSITLTLKNQRIYESLESFDSLPADAQVRAAVVCRLLDCSRATLWRKLQQKTIPTPRREATNVLRWRVGDLREYLNDPGSYIARSAANAF